MLGYSMAKVFARDLVSFDVRSLDVPNISKTNSGVNKSYRYKNMASEILKWQIEFMMLAKNFFTTGT
jgi:hypothetical protein